MRALHAIRQGTIRDLKKLIELPLNPIELLILLLIALAAVLWYLKFYGVTHEEIYEAVTEESVKVQSVVDDRYQRLDRKLDRIEGKLDKLLEIANRPLPDGMQRAE